MAAKTNGSESSLSFDEAKTAFGDTMLRVVRGQRLRLTRYGKVQAAIIPADDLELLEEFERRADYLLALATIKKKNRSRAADEVFRELLAKRRRRS